MVNSTQHYGWTSKSIEQHSIDDRTRVFKKLQESTVRKSNMFYMINLDKVLFWRQDSVQERSECPLLTSWIRGFIIGALSAGLILGIVTALWLTSVRKTSTTTITGMKLSNNGLFSPFNLIACQLIILTRQDNSFPYAIFIRFCETQ